MLLYYNGSTFRQLFQTFGSALCTKRVFTIAAFFGLATAGLQAVHWLVQPIEITLTHQFGMQMTTGIITFTLVWRTNTAWNRYWEAVTHLHFMYSKWSDAYSQFCGFISVTIQRTWEKLDSDPDVPDAPIIVAEVIDKVSLLRDMQSKIENDFLLLSAMACDRICRGDCARMERRHTLGVNWDDKLVLREELRKGADLTNSKGMPKFRKSARQSVMASRPGVHSTSSDDIDIAGFWAAEYVVNKPPKGMKFDLLKHSADRANMVVNWLNHNLAYISSDLTIAPPIQSRMYQEVSNGMLGFNNAVKLADVPVAFPYAQIVDWLLFIWGFFIPVYCVSLMDTMIGGPATAFVLAMMMFALNDVARELENPFGQGPNAICVPEFHSRFLLVVRDASLSSQNPPLPPKLGSIDLDEQLFRGETAGVMRERSNISSKRSRLSSLLRSSTVQLQKASRVSRLSARVPDPIGSGGTKLVSPFAGMEDARMEDDDDKKSTTTESGSDGDDDDELVTDHATLFEDNNTALSELIPPNMKDNATPRTQSRASSNLQDEVPDEKALGDRPIPDREIAGTPFHHNLRKRQMFKDLAESCEHMEQHLANMSRLMKQLAQEGSEGEVDVTL